MKKKYLKTISKPASARFSDRGSQFLSFAYPVMDKISIENIRTKIAEKYPDATHHSYAWRFDPYQPQEFAQDDGEPSGTAGQPILGIIKSENLVNVLIIVVRYYGGTKLGKPGLIRAYREAADLALEQVSKIALDRFVPFTIRYPYDQENRIAELINRYDLVKETEQYFENVTIHVCCKADQAHELQNILEQLMYLGIRHTTSSECFRPVASRNDPANTDFH